MFRIAMAVMGLFVGSGFAAAGPGDLFPEKVKDFGITPRGPVLVHYFRFTNNTNQTMALGQPRVSAGPGFAIFTVIDGRVECAGRTFERGAFFLLPATATDREVRPLSADARVLRTTIPPPKAI